MAKVCWQCGTRFQTERVARATVDARGVTRVYEGVVHVHCPCCGYSYHDFGRARLVREIPPAERRAPPVYGGDGVGEREPAAAGGGADTGRGRGEVSRRAVEPGPGAAEQPEG